MFQRIRFTLLIGAAVIAGVMLLALSGCGGGGY